MGSALDSTAAAALTEAADFMEEAVSTAKAAFAAKRL
jgi:hypothetical protein